LFLKGLKQVPQLKTSRVASRPQDQFCLSYNLFNFITFFDWWTWLHHPIRSRDVDISARIARKIRQRDRGCLNGVVSAVINLKIIEN
jgi:hypothetical protein